jgi:inhibitor of cysteine peptidase
MKLDQSFDNQAVTVSVGETVELALKENPTTGFRWTLTGPDTPVYELKTDDFVPSGPNPGAGGTRNIIFLVRRSGEATISLRNQRKWGGADEAGIFTLHIRATNAV